MELVCNDCGHDVAKIMDIEKLQGKGRISAECPECYNIVSFSGGKPIPHGHQSISHKTVWEFKDQKQIATCPECREPVVDGLSCEWCGLQLYRKGEFGRPLDWQENTPLDPENITNVGKLKRAWRELQENPESERYHYSFWSAVREGELYMEGAKRLGDLKAAHPGNQIVAKLSDGTLRSIEVLINFQQFEKPSLGMKNNSSYIGYQRTNRAVAWTLLAAALSLTILSILFF